MPDDKTNIPVDTPDVPSKDNLNIRASDKHVEDEKSHMGAKETQVDQKKPPTEELGNLSDRPLEKGNRKDDEYDPVDEITPG